MSGNLTPDFEVTETTWQSRQLLLSYPIQRRGVAVGRLWGSIDLSSLEAELARFAEKLQATETDSRHISFAWIGGGTLGVLLLCGGAVWFIIRNQTQRIPALKDQAADCTAAATAMESLSRPAREPRRGRRGCPSARR